MLETEQLVLRSSNNIAFTRHTASKKSLLERTESPYRFGNMDDLLKWVKTYRVTTGLSERLRLAENIFRVIEPSLRLFVHGLVGETVRNDVLQESLKAIATSLGTFRGDSESEFWAWAYRTTRNKVNDHLRRKLSDRLQPMPAEELWELVEASTQSTPLSAADRHDLDYAIRLLVASRPDCYDFLWQHYVFGMAYAEIAEEKGVSYDAARMKIGRCLEEAQALVS